MTGIMCAVAGMSAGRLPGAPTGVSGTATGTTTASISFTPPSDLGNPTLTSYTVVSSPGSITATGSSSPITVSGLTSGVAYTFTVYATNSLGNGPSSSASGGVVTWYVPGAPTGVSATAGSQQATVSFTAPANAGNPASITGYRVTSSPGSITATGSSSPIVVTGLTAGTAYTFTVQAQNAAGYGAASSASNSVTPTGPTSASFTTPGTYSWTAPANVTSVCVVCVGGGGGGGYGDSYGCAGAGGSLRYVNNISVSPGSSYTVVVGAGGARGVSGDATGKNGGTSSFRSSFVVAPGGGGGGLSAGQPITSGAVGSGGNGGAGGSNSAFDGGGGGAGGYSGNGGAGASGYNVSSGAGSGGGGGGGGGGSGGAGGGGVGLLGQGASGGSAPSTSMYSTVYGGQGGSGGASTSNGVSGGAYQTGGAYGGGGGAGYGGGNGGSGGVRIIWGAGRAFPSTNTG